VGSGGEFIEAHRSDGGHRPGGQTWLFGEGRADSGIPGIHAHPLLSGRKQRLGLFCLSHKGEGQYVGVYLTTAIIQAGII